MITKPRERGHLGGRRGNAVIEFALAFVVLVPVLLFSFEFGYTFYIYNEMQSAVRSGVRFASLQTYTSATATPTQDWSNAVKNVVVYGNPSGGTAPVVPGLTTGDVSVVVTFENAVPHWVTVSIGSYQANAVVRMLDIRTKPKLTVQYSGRWDPTT